MDKVAMATVKATATAATKAMAVVVAVDKADTTTMGMGDMVATAGQARGVTTRLDLEPVVLPRRLARLETALWQRERRFLLVEMLQQPLLPLLPLPPGVPEPQTTPPSMRSTTGPAIRMRRMVAMLRMWFFDFFGRRLQAEEQTCNLLTQTQLCPILPAVLCCCTGTAGTTAKHVATTSGRQLDVSAAASTYQRGSAAAVGPAAAAGRTARGVWLQRSK